MTQNNHENTYIGLTIGPIFKTIEHAKKTGELWGASYMFSYIMKNIIRKLREEDSKIKDRFIVPCVTDDKIFEKPKETCVTDDNIKNHMEIGLFHDRLIFKSDEGDFEKVRKAVEEVKAEFKKDVLKKFICYTAM